MFCLFVWDDDLLGTMCVCLFVWDDDLLGTMCVLFVCLGR